MRVIGGEKRGFKLSGESAGPVRPITDMAKEALFNILGPDVAGVSVLDLFAGTGSLGIEALSRGARRAVFVERDPEVLGHLERNIDRTGYVQEAEILRRDAYNMGGRLARLGPFDVVFVDPPYADTDALEPGSRAARLVAGLAVGGTLADGGWLVLRARKGSPAADLDFGLGPPDVRRYGTTLLLIYRKPLRPERS